MPSIRRIHNLPPHNRRHHFPRKLPSIKRSVARQRPRLGGFERPALLGIEDSYVREAAADQRSASPKFEAARGTAGEGCHDARKSNIPLPHNSPRPPPSIPLP